MKSTIRKYFGGTRQMRGWLGKYGKTTMQLG
jgi:hypothetical protein